MDIANLQAFLAVAEDESFSVAAEHLFLTQPAVSKRVRTLEESLDCRLFDRVGRRVLLTEAGRTLLPRARRILAELDDSRRALSNLAGEVGGRLRIGTSHHIGLHRLPGPLRAFVHQHPQVELDIQFLDSEAGMRAVAHGELELAVVTLPPNPPDALTILPVWPDPLAVVAAPDHPLTARKRVSVANLAEHPAVLPAEGTYTREITEAALAPHGVRLQVSMATNYLETIKMLVSVGLGWSVLPESMLDRDLRRVPVTGFHPARTLGMVLHPGLTLSNAGAALRDLLLGYA